MRTLILIFLTFMLVTVFSACDDDEFDFEDQLDDSTTRIHTDRTYFKDEQGRYLYIHGVNLSGSTKVPASYDPISYTGKPFPIEEADWNFKMLRDMGFNSVRLLINWEGIEPYKKGEYDEQYLDSIEQVVAKAEQYGIYCLLDMHQDIFSRHLMKFFNDETGENALPDPVEQARVAPFGYNNKVQGDGAPAWVVQKCLPEKHVGGSGWGLPFDDVAGPKETCDFQPFTFWGFNVAFSLDSNRCFAAFLAGRDVYPQYLIEGQNIQDYLQDAYTDAWAQVAMRVADYTNVLGYDIINEPVGLFIILNLYAELFKGAGAQPSGELSEDQVTTILDQYLENLWFLGFSTDYLEQIRDMTTEYNILPTSQAQMEINGFTPMANSPYAPDLGAVGSLHIGFSRKYMAPFLGKVGAAIQQIDPDAIIFLEQAMAIPLSGELGIVLDPMLRPEGLDQVVWAPHYYTDIYPRPGVNASPRDFDPNEMRFRDMTDGISGATDLAQISLGNPPVVLGEFGTYWNYGGIDKSMAEDYIVSQYLLERQYVAFEELMVHQMVWCYSPENTTGNGELWNKEDFSVLGPDQQPRGQDAYSRAYPRFASGRLLEFHYNSPLAYYDPRPGVPEPYLEFYMEMEAKETDAPTEIFVPPHAYTEGIYVYITDGRCAFDDDTHVLYWYPSNDDPKAVHTLKIRPPYEDYGDSDWDYFFNGEQVLEGQK